MIRTMPNHMTFSKLWGDLTRFVCSPWIILLSAVLGVLCGICFPGFSQKLSLGGEIYLNYITLLTIPLMIGALSSSLASLIQQNRSEQRAVSLKKMFVFLVSMYLLIGSLGIASEVTVSRLFPYQFDVERLDELLHTEEKSQTDYTIRIFNAPTESEQKQFSLREFILESFPTNIFQSLSHGDALHILIFSILFGLALGMLPSEKSQHVILVLSDTYQACLFLIQCSMYVLPFCLFCLLATKISLLDYSMLKLVSQFLLTIFALEVFLTVLGVLLWSCVLRVSVKSLIKMEGKTMLIAIGTCQSFVVMPLLMQDMEEKMHYSSEQLKLVVPFVFTMGKFTRISSLAVTSVFVSFLYYGDFSWTMIPLLLLVAPPLSIGGAWPLVVTALLKILGLPGELGLLLLVTINPFIDPLSTLCNVIYGGLFSSLTIKKSDQKQEVAS